MDINNNQIRRTNNEMRQKDVAPVVTEELMAAFIGEDQRDDKAVDKAKKKQQEEVKQKEKSGRQPTGAAAFIEEKADIKDLIGSAAKKLSEFQLNSARGKLGERMQQELQKSVDDYFQNEAKDKSKDTVVLSKNVLANMKKEDLRLRGDTQEHQQRDTLNALKQSNVIPQPTMPGLKEEVSDRQRIQSEQFRAQELLTQPQTEQKVRQFVSAYSSAVIEKDIKKKQEADRLRQELTKLGIDPDALRNAELKVSNMVRDDIKKQMKRGFINLALTYNPEKMTPELLNANEEMKRLAELADLEGVFGEGRGSLNDVKEEARREMREFITDQLDQVVTSGKIKGSSPQEIIAAFDRFNTLAGFAKFNAGAYMKQFQKKLDDLGLNDFVNPEPKTGVIDNNRNMQSGSEGGGNSGRQSQEEGPPEDQLRTLFMQKAIRKDVKSQFEIQLKIRKLKSVLKERGTSDTMLKTLQQEGEALAKMRLTDMLKEALEERATLVELRGSAYELVKNKIGTALKGLKELDAPVRKSDFIQMRDHVNKAIFSVVREEYLKLEVHLEASSAKDSFLVQKRKNYLSILERLKEESSLPEEIKPASMRHIIFSSDTSIAEAA